MEIPHNVAFVPRDCARTADTFLCCVACLRFINSASRFRKAESAGVTAVRRLYIYIYTSLRGGYLLETLVLKNRTQLVKKVFFDKLIYLMISPAASLARISFMASLWLRFTRPFSSISVTLTHIMSPTLQASSTFSMRLSASLEM